MRFGGIICMSAIATCIAFSSFAQGLPKANKPEDVGFSSERLKRVTASSETLDLAVGFCPLQLTSLPLRK
jgi:hypothetical protein